MSHFVFLIFLLCLISSFHKNAIGSSQTETTYSLIHISFNSWGAFHIYARQDCRYHFIFVVYQKFNKDRDNARVSELRILFFCITAKI